MINLPVNIFYSSETNQYIGFVPGLTWMHTQWDTIDEVLNNLQQLYEMLKEDEDFKKELANYTRFIWFYSFPINAEVSSS